MSTVGRLPRSAKSRNGANVWADTCEEVLEDLKGLDLPAVGRKQIEDPLAEVRAEVNEQWEKKLDTFSK